MPTQLPLPVRLPDEASFANFLVCAQNRAAVEALRHFLAAGHGSLFLHGPPGSGRTHLLQAGCHEVEARGGAIVYLPLGELRDAPPAELFAGLEAHALLCLDDADAVAGRRDWEEAMFHLYNRCLETGCRLLLAAARPPQQAGLVLADLRSRLQGGAIGALGEPADEGKIAALVLRAHNRGITLEPGVARFVWQRSPRGMAALIAVLDRLDTASLGAGRRLSIPFVKSVMGW
ncbi:MAG: DnaA regulatory inactivator Hda [Gammaproteobacteria bacterium]|nr:DnaA regulatory inactivator Hda [Gammaproteobacteria bacterium]